MHEGRHVIASTALALVLLVAGLAAGQALRAGQSAPEIAGERWINSGPLTTAGLRGRVVLVEFWTYG
jgi:hypothetical protein